MEAAVAAAIKPGAPQRKAVARRASIAKQEAQEAALGPRLSEQSGAAEPEDDPIPTPKIANEPPAARPVAARKIWDLEDGDDAPEGAAEEPAPKPVAEVAPVQTGSGRASRRAGRVKTRLLGFQPVDDLASDIFETANGASKKTGGAGTQVMFPVGWIVVAKGDGRGASFTLFSGVSQIGRGDDQAIKLDFGDTSISRSNHAAVAYDEETGKFFLGHGGKSNIVRLNGKPVLSTEELTSNDVIRIGETTLRFIALCGEDFDWISDADETAGQAAVG
ncbi:MAG: FHA domain-containing protein [Alphaproteobacteria bacterium]|nr:FHA domain-containing protein [Alphaproteobacteria bacterium]NNF23334.1 FHA domain-containing protein [Paracoccaceae bacterium]